MKLKNKLIISFLMIMAIPLFLFCVFSVVLVRYQFVIIQNSYGVSAELTDFFPNNNKLFSQLMNNVQLKLQDEIEEVSCWKTKRCWKSTVRRRQENLLM